MQMRKIIEAFILNDRERQTFASIDIDKIKTQIYSMIHQ